MIPHAVKGYCPTVDAAMVAGLDVGDSAAKEIGRCDVVIDFSSHDATRGLLEPESFIAQAESTGLIGPLSFSIMEQALKEARSWPAHLKIAVNISPVQFRDPALAQDILKILTATGFPARRLEL